MTIDTSSHSVALTIVCLIALLVLGVFSILAHRLCLYLEHRFGLLTSVPMTRIIRIGFRLSTLTLFTELSILFAGFGTRGTAGLLGMTILMQWACFIRLDTLRKRDGFPQQDRGWPHYQLVKDRP